MEDYSNFRHNFLCKMCWLTVKCNYFVCNGNLEQSSLYGAWVLLENKSEIQRLNFEAIKYMFSNMEKCI